MTKSKISLVVFFIIATSIAIFFSMTEKTKDNKFVINKNLDKLNLVTHKQELLSYEKVLSNPSIFFFGFISCPDICPNTLIEISKIIKNLGEQRRKISFYFVTVDPERDKLLELQEYLSNFDDEIIGVTGKSENVSKFLKSMHVYYKKIYIDESFYTLDHTSNLLVFKKNGNFFGTISFKEPEEVILQKIRSVI
ncbi:MAG: SCO family protein [Pseudomonadota bacterium]|nr:SCO family protein [Pseudomonadota bacterium]